jgi:RNA polymerase sigma-70 factor (ECF subfamily)
MDYSKISDLALVEKIRDRDQEAFAEIVSRYENRCYRLALKLTGNEMDAEEVLQDVFLSVYNKIDTFKGDAAFSSWIYRITANASYMKLRERKKEKSQQSSMSLEELSSVYKTGMHYGVFDWTEGLDDPSLDEDLSAVLQKAIAQLPEGYREVFVMRDIEGLSNEEVGKVTGLTVAAVKSRLHRSRMFLRKVLSDYLKDKA